MIERDWPTRERTWRPDWLRAFVWVLSAIYLIGFWVFAIATAAWLAGAL